MTTSRAARTRVHLQETALRLIEAQGYDGTTVEQIAAEAGVSHMTFFRHFPTKESVVLDDGFDPAIAAAVAHADASLPPLRRVCAGMRAALERLDLPEQEQVRRRVRVATGHPALRAGMHAGTEETREALVEVLRTDGADPFAARVCASAVLAALTVALQDWCLDDVGVPMADRLRAALDVLEEGAA